MSSRYWLAFAGALAALPAAAQAHHSFAAFFDPAKSVTVTGTVTEFRFTNPHGMIALDVKKSGGGVEQWRAETNAPVVLVQRGWNRDSIKPGMIVTIDGWPSRDGRNYMRMRAVKDANGKPIAASRESQSRVALTAPGASGSWPGALPNTRRSLIARLAAPTWPWT